MTQTVVLLINIGSPDSPSTSDVRHYLSRFLNDKRVMTMPFLLRKLLVNGIIVPFRAPKSSKTYQKIWTANGSPFTVYANKFAESLQNQFNRKDVTILNGMMYGQPLLDTTLQSLKNKIEKLIVVPMYPHYASSTTASALQAVFESVSNWENIPVIKTIQPFFNHKKYQDCLLQSIKQFDLDSFDHLLFSFHGLPLSHIKKSHTDDPVCSEGEDLSSISHSKSPFCYRAQCYETSKLILEKLNHPISSSVSFQSRLSKNWLSPFTDETLKRLASEGKKRVLVACPSFVVDCLETLYEIQDENNEVFIAAGGEKLTLVPSLNDNADWVATMAEIISTEK